MRNKIEVEEETSEGKAVFHIQAISPFKCFAGINKLVKLVGSEAFNVADPSQQAMSLLLSIVGNLTESQLSDLINLYLGGSFCIVNGENRAITPKMLDILMMGNPGGIIVLLATAIGLNYQNFPGAFERIKPTLEAMFPSKATA